MALALAACSRLTGPERDAAIRRPGDAHGDSAHDAALHDADPDGSPRDAGADARPPGDATPDAP